MNLSRLALLLLATTLTATAHAQLGLYGTVSVERVSGIKCLTTVCGSTDGTLNPLGGFGGVYYDFKTYGPVRLGVDARGGATITSKNAAQFQTGPKPRIYSALGGLRASFHTRYDFLHPYVEGAVGYGKSNVQTSTSATALEYPSGVEYRGFAGVDVRLLSFMDFRVAEFGIGALQLQGRSYRLESISSGLVFHLPGGR